MKRGSILVVALLIVTTLLIFGIGYLTSQSNRYQAAAFERAWFQAYQLAWAGLDDARAKLSKDRFFPPPAAIDQPTFTYQEEVVALDGVTRLGAYEVTVDLTWAKAPYSIVRMVSVGYAGRDLARPTAKRVLALEIDWAQEDRNTPGTPNAGLFQILNFEEVSHR